MATRKREPRILLWDIESTGLNATFGTILCIGWKFYGEKTVYVPSIIDGSNGDMLDDRALVKQFIEAYESCDYHVTWYGDRFDFPMVCSKAFKHDLPPIRPKHSLDLWKAVRYRFKAHSNRLAVWQQICKAKDSKTAIDFDAWLRAAHGDKNALAEVRHHCKKDVLVLEQVFRKLRPWLDNEPSRGLFTGDHDACPSCGSKHVTRQGFKVARTRKYQQLKCQSCGHWFREARSAEASPLR